MPSSASSPSITPLVYTASQIRTATAHRTVASNREQAALGLGTEVCLIFVAGTPVTRSGRAVMTSVPSAVQDWLDCYTCVATARSPLIVPSQGVFLQYISRRPEPGVERFV